jgi:hypothetical protein
MKLSLNASFQHSRRSEITPLAAVLESVALYKDQNASPPPYQPSVDPPTIHRLIVIIVGG